MLRHFHWTPAKTSLTVLSHVHVHINASHQNSRMHRTTNFRHTRKMVDYLVGHVGPLTPWVLREPNYTRGDTYQTSSEHDRTTLHFLNFCTLHKMLKNLIKFSLIKSYNQMDLALFWQKKKNNSVQYAKRISETESRNQFRGSKRDSIYRYRTISV